MIKTSEEKGCLNKYLYYFLSSIEIENSGKYERHFKYVKKLRVPLPPMDVQKKIVEECEKIDAQVERNNAVILDAISEISATIDALKGQRQSLKSFMTYGKGRVDYAEIAPNSYISTDNMLQNCEGVKPYEGVPNVGTVVAYQKGDILLSNIRPYLKKLWMADCYGGCSPDVLVLHNEKEDSVDSAFIYYSLRRQEFFDYIMSDIKGMKMPRGKKETIEKYEITLPSVEIQKEVVKKLQKLDEQIKEANQQIANASSAKQAILDKYLK